MGNLQPEATKTFYLNEVLTTTNSDLLIEVKYYLGALLYSKKIDWDHLIPLVQSLHGGFSYLIGPGIEQHFRLIPSGKE